MTSSVDEHRSDPLWFKDAVFYELPVKSFFDGNSDGYGDFVGLTRKLDYLAELGVTCLWLLPFFASPKRDDGYDVSDYRAVDPIYGDRRSFEYFLAEVHRREMRVIAEMVINHTSNDHPWFQAARSAPPGSPLRDFYVWSNSDRRYAAASVLFPDVQGSNWTWDTIARAYYWHRFFPHQPDLNYQNPAVLVELLKVLRFWLDLGLDGLCLSGISYLVEAEGTDCENLPETHAILKQIRRALGTTYPHCVVIAGVNQWPSHAYDYFGQGEECQMVLHLPLAQRLFLAISQEDSHPLATLLEQTPKPPDQTQWALLLRNHDELTLSLATDEDRDYMYQVYAADPRMRLHQGIRRRLAPLVDNDRRRIELLMGLLLSLPGSPILYYGDELGMGDNIYLGGRNSVRTPMQWTPDRNAGFSTTDFARLYAPPVTDPIYGYQAVNAEAQLRDASSLFHWIRRLIALRRRSRAFSRGEICPVESSNRHIFAYIRRHGDETILIAANLAGSVQPAPLDLASHSGLIPVEMLGRSVFLPLSKEPWVLTLPGYGFYWFRLVPEVRDLAVRWPPVELADLGSLPIIPRPARASDLFESEASEHLFRPVLTQYLPTQRWFGGKARQIDTVSVLDWGCLPVSRSDTYLVLIEVHFSDGGRDTYFLPLAITQGPAAETLLQANRKHVLARLQCTGGDAILHDALADDRVCTAILDLIAENAAVPLGRGQLRGFSTGAFTSVRGDVGTPLAVARASETSSNTLVIYGKRLLFKLFRRLEAGTNPDLEIGRFLTDRSPFSRIPKVAGAIEYWDSRGRLLTLGIFQALVRNQGDGWQYTIDELGRYYTRASARMFAPDPITPDTRSLLERAVADPPPAFLETVGTYLHTAETLGRRTAEMHLALAQDRMDPAFAPEPVTHADLAHLIHEVLDFGRNALETLRRRMDQLPSAVAADGHQLMQSGGPWLNDLKRSHLPDDAGLKIRCHGDYHLGQVLWVDNDFIILDFEGEPTRTVEQRRAKHSPLKDVAGMIRSFNYAAYAGLFAFAEHHPGDFERLQPWAELWQQWAAAVFLRAYRATAHAFPLLPQQPEHLARLLRLFLLDKAFYELVYELNNRPDWVRIPLQGILTLMRDEQPVAVSPEPKGE